MEDLIDLTKEAEIVLEKVSAPKIVARVGAIFDVSGSAAGMYKKKNGKPSQMQSMANRFFAIGYMFDDNQTLDSIFFDTKAEIGQPITEDLFGTYIERFAPNDKNGKWWNGTNYCPPLQVANDFYFGAGIPQDATGYDEVTETIKGEEPGFFGRLLGKKAQTSTIVRRVPRAGGTLKSDGDDPVYLAFLTDGDNYDKVQTERMLASLASKDIYVMFIGITDSSNPDFSFIERMSNQFQHVGFYDGGNIDELTTAALYDKMLSPKFVSWYNKVKGA